MSRRSLRHTRSIGNAVYFTAHIVSIIANSIANDDHAVIAISIAIVANGNRNDITCMAVTIAIAIIISIFKFGAVKSNI